MDNNTLLNKIHNNLNKANYLDKNGGNIFVMILTILIVFFLSTYYWILRNAEPIKTNWPRYKCQPGIIPFAGIIKGKPGKVMEFTANNFSLCLNDVLATIVSIFTTPISILTNILLSTFSLLLKIMNKIRQLYYSIKKKIFAMFDVLQGIIVNTQLPVIKLLIKLRDSFAKMIGIMAGSMLTILGINFAYKSFMKNLITIFITFLVVTAVVIYALWLFPWTWPAAAASLIPWVITATFMSIITGWMVYIVNATKVAVPGAPGKPANACFDEYTPIKLYNGKSIPIKILKPNDVLLNNVKVNTVIKIRNNQNMFNLNNTIVSGTHYVFYNNKWILVADHPKAIHLPNYNKKFIYCINTSTKRIILNDTIYADWDDLTRDDFFKLRNSKQINDFNTNNIHTLLNAGFQKNTPIRLNNNKTVNISDVRVNDILYNNEIVTGIVKIDATDLKHIYSYKFDDFNIIGSNLFLTSSHLGEFHKQKTKTNDNFFYHLLTNTSTFSINDITFYDYNSAIEHRLDIYDNI